MSFPLSEAEYFRLTAIYNLATWPAQAGLFALALLVAVMAARGTRGANLGLAALWIFAGAAYFVRLMAVLTPVGYVLGGLFLLEGVLILKAEFKLQKGIMPSLGGTLVIYVMVVYPLAESFLGRGWPLLQTVGLPLPTAMFTLGLFLWAAEQVPGYVLAIPVFFSLAGSVPALLFGTYEDLGLLVAGIGALTLFGRKRTTPLERL